MKLKKLLILPALFFAFSISAQQPHPVTNLGGCGYVGHSEWLDWYRNYRESFIHDTERGADTTWLFVPVTVHLVGTDAGSNYFRVIDAMRAVCEMNEQYRPGFIQYYLHPDEPFVYHNNTKWFKHDWDGGAEMIETSNLPDRLNAYVVDDPAGNCGYSWYDAIVLGKGCSAVGNSTWAHEAGHHFSLPHPFLGWEGENFPNGSPAPETIGWANVEKMDSSNCYDAGDYFCDTRPDYISNRWQCDANRESYSLLTDPNGVEFRADATLYMSYSYDECASRFSAEQYEAMRTNLYTEHLSYLTEWEQGPMINDDERVNLTSPIDSQTAQYNHVTLNWEPVAGADYYFVEISLSASFPFTLISKMVYGETSLTLNGGIPNNRFITWRVRAYSRWDLCQPNKNYQIGVFKTVNLSATNDLERVASIDLMPNPIAAGLPAQIVVESSINLDATLQLLDMNGKTLWTKPARLANGSNTFDIETNELAAGIYHVILQTAKGSVIKKLCVIE